MIPLETDRLILRKWRAGDSAPFAAMNSCPKVMEFFPKLMTHEESDQMIGRIQKQMDEIGFCYYAAELKATKEFIGFIGLARPNFQAHFTPCTEIGWRLAFAHWNKGLATEGAKRVLQYAFRELGLVEIVSFTTIKNLPSRKVMEKIGMKYDMNGDFIHPRVPEGHPIAPHVLYRLPRQDWQA